MDLPTCAATPITLLKVPPGAPTVCMTEGDEKDDGEGQEGIDLKSRACVASTGQERDSVSQNSVVDDAPEKAGRARGGLPE